MPTCPAVTYSPANCEPDLTGKKGDKLTVPATIHKLKGGYSYYCPSHESCVDVGSLSIKGCSMKQIARQKGESPEYLGHIVVE